MNIKSNSYLLFSSILLLFPTMSFAGDWSFEIEPYALISTIDGDASLGRINGAQVDVKFDDILENLDMAAMLHFEAHHKNGWGVALDYGFMDLGADITGPLGGVTDVGVRQGVLEALLVRRKKIENGHLDYLFGIRWWDNDLDLDVDSAILPGTRSTRIDEDWVDVVVGMRMQKNINSKWAWQMRGDLGGFGLESDFTAVAAAGARYKMTKNWELDLQYKATWVDYENDKAKGQPGYFAYDTVTHGPLIGFNYKF